MLEHPPSISLTASPTLHSFLITASIAGDLTDLIYFIVCFINNVDDNENDDDNGVFANDDDDPLRPWSMGAEPSVAAALLQDGQRQQRVWD